MLILQQRTQKLNIKDVNHASKSLFLRIGEFWAKLMSKKMQFGTSFEFLILLVLIKNNSFNIFKSVFIIQKFYFV